MWRTALIRCIAVRIRQGVSTTIEDAAFAEVAFITHSSVIAAVLPPEDVEKMKSDSCEMPTNDTDDDEDTIKFKKKFKIGF